MSYMSSNTADPLKYDVECTIHTVYAQIIRKKEPSDVKKKKKFVTYFLYL